MLHLKLTAWTLLLFFTFQPVFSSTIEGIWSNETITLNINNIKGKQAKGILTHNGMAFKIELERSIHGYQGFFHNEIGRFPIFISIQGESAMLETESGTFQLTKQAERNESPPITETEKVSEAPIETLEELETQPKPQPIQSESSPPVDTQQDEKKSGTTETDSAPPDQPEPKNESQTDPTPIPTSELNTEQTPKQKEDLSDEQEGTLENQKPAPETVVNELEDLTPAEPEIPQEASLSLVSLVQFQHPLGLQCYIPSDWQIQRVNDLTFFLVPPDFGQVDGMQAEVIMLVVESSAGVATIENERVANSSEQMMTQIVPSMRRKGSAEDIGDNALKMAWEGYHSQLNTELQGKIWAKIIGPYIVQLLGAAPKATLGEREAVLSNMFNRIKYEEPEIDRQYVGIWKSESSQSAGGFNSVTVRHLALAPDGQCGEVSNRSSAEETLNSLGNIEAFTGSLASVPGWERFGRWTLTSGRIILHWSNGSIESWNVQLEDGLMKWQGDESRRDWQRERTM